MDRDTLIAQIRATGTAETIAALEALGAEPSIDALTSLLEATKTPAAPPDPATQSARAATKKPGKLPVRVGANVTTAKGKGKVTAVAGDQVTVTLADGSTETLSVSAMRAHMAVKGNKKKHTVPAAEADILSNEDSWDDIMADVRDAVRNQYGYSATSYPGPYCYTVAVFDDYVIVSADDAFYRVTWSQDPATDVVTLGALEPVELQYVTTTDGMGEGCILGPLDDDGRLLEADAKVTGNKWAVVVIQEGLSKNRNFYPAEVLREAAPLYENRPIYLNHDTNPGRFGRSPEDAIGFIKSVRATQLAASQESEQTGRTALVATAVILDSGWRRKLVEAWEEGNPNFVGLSHDVKVTGRLVVGDVAMGGPYKRAEKIEAVESVDLVMNPAAGGRLMSMVASNVRTDADLEDVRMLQKMIEAIKASKRADLIAALEALGEHATEDVVLKLHAKLGTAASVPVQEAAQPAAAAVDPNAPKPLSVQEADELRTFARESRKRTALLLVDANVRECALPQPIKDRLKKRLTAMVEAGQVVTEDLIVAEIREDVEAFGKIAESGVAPKGGGRPPRFEVSKSTREQFTEALDEFFGMKKSADGKYVVLPHARAMSFRSLYTGFTGDVDVTGRVEEATRLTESLDSTSFTKILGDSITRRMVAEYQLPEFQMWRGLIGDVVPLNDFRTQRRLRFGGYGNLAIVAQGAPYLAMTSPTDEEATYSPAKRGGTEAVTLEMIKNDDVGVIKKIPVRLGRAAGQTLYEFVFDFMRVNPAIYDSTALAAAGHGSNISTTALSLSQLSNGRLVMREQTDMSSGKRLGLKARYLWVPVDLDDLAWQITGAEKMVPDSNLAASAEPAAPNPGKRYGVQPMVVDYWTDTNNYWITASVDQCPMIEVGFLDGREDPELFVQDAPNVGSLFTNDAITWKIRHIYGGGVLDFRGFFGGIVP
jgi:hypothetical protein